MLLNTSKHAALLQGRRLTSASAAHRPTAAGLPPSLPQAAPPHPSSSRHSTHVARQHATTRVITRFKPEERSEEQTEAPANKVPVLFKLKKHCEFGQHWGICGSAPQFGSWEPGAALPMQWAPGDEWFAVAELPEGSHIEFKHVLHNPQTGKCMWVNEAAPNHTLDVRSGSKVVDRSSTVQVGGGNGAPDVWQLVREMEEGQKAVAPSVEVVTVIDGMPMQESITLTAAPNDVLAQEEWHEVGSRGPERSSTRQTQSTYEPPTDLPPSVIAVPPGAGGAPPAVDHETAPSSTFTQDSRQAVSEASEAIEDAHTKDIMPEEPTPEELGFQMGIEGAIARAEPPPSEQAEQAHIALSGSQAMMSDDAAMSPRSKPNAAASLMGQDQGPMAPHGFLPKVELADPEKLEIVTKSELQDALDATAASAVQLVQRAGRMAATAYQHMGADGRTCAEMSLEASQRVADAAQDAACGYVLDWRAVEKAKHTEAENLLQKQKDDVVAMAEQASAAAAEAASTVSEGTGPATHDSAQLAFSSAERAAEALAAAKKGTLDAAKVAAQDAKAAAASAKEAASQNAHEIFEIARLAASSAEDLSEGAAGEAKVMGKDAAGAVSERSKGVVKAVQDLGKGVAGTARGMTEDLTGVVRGQSKGVAQAASDVGEGVVEGAAESAREAVDAVKSAASGIVPDVAADITSTEAADQLEEATDEEATGTVQEGLQSQQPPRQQDELNMGDAMSGAAEGLKAFLDFAFQEVPRGMASKVKELLSPEGASELEIPAPDAEQQQAPTSSGPRGSAPGGLLEVWDYTLDPQPFPPAAPSSPPFLVSAPTAAEGVETTESPKDEPVMKPGDTGRQFDSVAEVVQSSKYKPKPGPLSDAFKQAEEEEFQAPGKPLFQPRLSYMSIEDRKALEKERLAAYLPLVPEDYEAGAEAGNDFPDSQVTAQDVGQVLGDVLEEPEGIPPNPLPQPQAGEGADVQDVE